MRSSKKEPFVPQYRHIYDDLREKIRSGTYGAGAQLPFERVLCEQYGVERITVRRALEMLAKDGLITKRAGLGSFVSDAHSIVEPTAPKPRTILFGMHRNQNDIEHNVNAFNAQLFFIMEQACNAHGYSLMYCGVNEGDKVLPQLNAAGVAGIMLTSMQSDELIQSAIDTALPVICINHYDPRVLCIIPDNHSGVELAIDHLYKLGHRRIAMINGTPRYTNAIERLEGYQAALSKRSLPFVPELVINGNWTFERGRTAIDELFQSLPRNHWPTAVFAASDMTALGAIDGAKNHGLSVPEDISIIGFDNINMCNYCSPPLTSIGTNARQLADIAVEHLTRLIERPIACSDRYTIRTPSEFILRASTSRNKGV